MRIKATDKILKLQRKALLDKNVRDIVAQYTAHLIPADKQYKAVIYELAGKAIESEQRVIDAVVEEYPHMNREATYKVCESTKELIVKVPDEQAAE